MLNVGNNICARQILQSDLNLFDSFDINGLELLFPFIEACLGYLLCHSYRGCLIYLLVFIGLSLTEPSKINFEMNTQQEVTTLDKTFQDSLLTCQTSKFWVFFLCAKSCCWHFPSCWVCQTNKLVAFLLSLILTTSILK